MQEGYLAARRERLAVLADVVHQSQRKLRRIVDLGCGTGSVLEVLAHRFGRAEVVGLDVDERLLALARQRLAGYGERVRVVGCDLRSPNWGREVGGRAEAVVSATCLHWFSPQRLSRLYRDIREVLVEGGIFLNADHVRSDVGGIESAWEEQRAARRRQAAADVDDWEGFWRAFNAALEIDGEAYEREVLGPWEGAEEGQPLWWHFRELGAAGLACCDCFWRRGGDAIYGAVRPPEDETGREP